jgi:hypothetical protein
MLVGGFISSGPPVSDVDGILVGSGVSVLAGDWEVEMSKPDDSEAGISDAPVGSSGILPVNEPVPTNVGKKVGSSEVSWGVSV